VRRSVRSCVEGASRSSRSLNAVDIVEIGAWLLGYYSNGAHGAQMMRNYRLKGVMGLSGGTGGRAS
jgi:hypothetical protein